MARDFGHSSCYGVLQHHEGLDDFTGKMIAENQCRASQLTAVIQENQSFRQSGDETVGTGPFGDLPILIFSQDPQPSAPSKSSTQADVEFSKIWNEMQEELKHLSTHSRRIIAKGSSHNIQVDRPDLLNSKVTRLHSTDSGQGIAANGLRFHKNRIGLISQPTGPGSNS